MSTPAFSPEVVDAVCRHMNDDHRADAVLICRHLAGVADVVDAETVGLDGTGIRFAVRHADGTAEEVTVPFARLVTERAQVRAAVVELHERARALAGAAPGPHAPARVRP